ncbi:calcium-binding protein [Sorangium sp. So ce1099]|uniref:calcium-binding protein n=1 Tax=Sorangium sp. So ce1099 TaxID=3133331 RepID=UPI003F620E00
MGEISMATSSRKKEPGRTKLTVGASRRSARLARKKVDETRLRRLVEEATVDAHGESEQRVGFLTMIQDHVDVPFETEVLDVPVQVIGIDLDDAEEIVATCKRGARVQRIPVLDLPVPQPTPKGFEWIEAYRFFRRGGG